MWEIVQFSFVQLIDTSFTLPYQHIITKTGDERFYPSTCKSYQYLNFSKKYHLEHCIKVTRIEEMITI